MNEPLIIPDENVISRIYRFRNRNVMLDSDLADLYNIETRTLNQALKRNMRRFPDDFMFQLTEEEFEQASGTREQTWRKTLHASRIYRAWCTDAFQCAQQ